MIAINLRQPGAMMLTNRGRRSGFADIEWHGGERRIVLEPGERKAVTLAAGIYQVTATADLAVCIKEQA